MLSGLNARVSLSQRLAFQFPPPVLHSHALPAAALPQSAERARYVLACWVVVRATKNSQL